MSRVKGRLSPCAGMTLVEVMTATVLVALLALLMMTVFGASTNQMQEGRRISSGAAAGVALIEENIAGAASGEDLITPQAVSISFNIEGRAGSASCQADYYETTQDELTVYGFKVKSQEVTP